MEFKKDYYKILDINEFANAIQIKRAYRSLALKWHPDRVPSAQKVHAEVMFKEITNAYFILGHPQRRAAYDEQRTNPSPVEPEKPAPQRPDRRKEEEARYEEFLKKHYQDYRVPDIDWREILGGRLAKIIAVIIGIIYYSLFHNEVARLPFLEFYYLAFLSYIYIIFEPVREFLRVSQDFSLLLLLSWVVIGMSFLMLLGTLALCPVLPH